MCSFARFLSLFLSYRGNCSPSRSLTTLLFHPPRSFEIASFRGTQPPRLLIRRLSSHSLQDCTRTSSFYNLLRVTINSIYTRVYVATIRSLFYDHRSRIDPRSNVLYITGYNYIRINPAGSSGLIAVEDATPTWHAPPCASSHPGESSPTRSGAFRARSYRIRRSLHCSPGLLVHFDLFRLIM